MITKKIVLIGDFSTGKTSLIRRYVDNQFSDAYLTTIGVKISKKILNLPSDVEIQLLIWDIEGQTDVKATNPAYVMGAHGVIIVADILREKSIDSIKEHIEASQKILKNVPMVLALNKSDLIQNEFMLEKLLHEIEGIYSELDALYPTSAKDDRNVATLFEKIAQLTLQDKRG